MACVLAWLSLLVLFAAQDPRPAAIALTVAAALIAWILAAPKLRAQNGTKKRLEGG